MKMVFARMAKRESKVKAYLSPKKVKALRKCRKCKKMGHKCACLKPSPLLSAKEQNRIRFCTAWNLSRSIVAESESEADETLVFSESECETTLILTEDDSSDRDGEETNTSDGEEGESFHFEETLLEEFEFFPAALEDNCFANDVEESLLMEEVEFPEAPLESMDVELPPFSVFSEELLRRLK